MADDVSPAAIKQTRDILSNIIVKPPLTEKLLQKPPFRYLHDIITNVIKETGCLKDLYTARELDSNNVKDKDSKIVFLDKLIKALENSTGSKISARSTKIIAGLEVNKTLELLQTFGTIAAEKSNEKTKLPVEEPANKNKADESPQKVTETTNQEESVQKSKVPEPTDQSAPKSNKNVRDKVATNSQAKEVAKKKAPGKPAIDQKERTSVTRKNSTRESDKSPASRKNSSTEISKLKRTAGQSKSTPTRKQSVKESRSRVNSAKNVSIEEENEPAEKAKDLEVPEQKPKLVSIEEQETSLKPEVKEEKMESKPSTEVATQGKANDLEPEPPRVTKNDAETKKKETPIPRPGSARPGSRKIRKENSQNSESQASQPISIHKQDEQKRMMSAARPRTATRPPSARPGAPRIRDKGEVAAEEETKTPVGSVNVFEEGNQECEEPENYIVMESVMDTSPNQQQDVTEINDENQGHLVHQILKTQKELNEGVPVDTNQNRRTEIEWEAGRKKERETATKEIDNIRNTIQKLTSAANPLGKLIDFLQEDVDEMQRELDYWKDVNVKLHVQQSAELEIGKNALLPLRKDLDEIENSIQEEFQKINILKAEILSNDEKMLSLTIGGKMSSDKKLRSVF